MAKLGRPRLPTGKKREVPIGFRPTPDLRKRLQTAAEFSGRSISQEIVSRLEHSFWHDDMEKDLAEKRFA